MNASLKVQIVSFLKSGKFSEAVDAIEQGIFGAITATAAAALPAPVAAVAAPVLGAVEQGAVDATNDALTGQSARVLADLERDGSDALAGIAQDVEGIVRKYLPGPLGGIASDIVSEILSVLEAHITAATAPAIAAAQAKQIAARAGQSAQTAAAELAKV